MSLPYHRRDMKPDIRSSMPLNCSRVTAIQAPVGSLATVRNVSLRSGSAFYCTTPTKKNIFFFQIAGANSPPEVPESMSPPIRDVILRCLEPKPGDRPSARDLLKHPLFTLVGAT